ncbi:hypothetical protein [Streptomyces sp. NPDC006638]|uniref:hypothetical protein n=1 Tax=Streptomyces sp. NPDC006638 TaxID=3157183 RepID=UPI0033ACD5E0
MSISIYVSYPNQSKAVVSVRTAEDGLYEAGCGGCHAAPRTRGADEASRTFLKGWADRHARTCRALPLN